jgi:hypothetical protein
MFPINTIELWHRCYDAERRCKDSLTTKSAHPDTCTCIGKTFKRIFSETCDRPRVIEAPHMLQVLMNAPAGPIVDYMALAIYYNFLDGVEEDLLGAESENEETVLFNHFFAVEHYNLKRGLRSNIDPEAYFNELMDKRNKALAMGKVIYARMKDADFNLDVFIAGNVSEEKTARDEYGPTNRCPTLQLIRDAEKRVGMILSLLEAMNLVENDASMTDVLVVDAMKNFYVDDASLNISTRLTECVHERCAAQKLPELVEFKEKLDHLYEANLL